MESKIVYGIRPLNKNEKRATMREAIIKHKVSYWGLNKVDKRLMMKLISNKGTNSREEVVKNMFKYSRQLKALLKLKKETTAPKKLEKIQASLARILPLYKKTKELFDKFDKEKKLKADKEDKLQKQQIEKMKPILEKRRKYIKSNMDEAEKLEQELLKKKYVLNKKTRAEIIKDRKSQAEKLQKEISSTKYGSKVKYDKNTFDERRKMIQKMRKEAEDMKKEIKGKSYEKK